jgi:hypothetical protein
MSQVFFSSAAPVTFLEWLARVNILIVTFSQMPGHYGVSVKLRPGK